MVTYKKIISKFHKKKILVIGDIILDQYIQGRVSRISPEAPVPVVLEDTSFYTPGGASNVAHNLSSLGAQVTVVGRIGDDREGKILKKELGKKDINAVGVFVDKKMPTALKTRIIAQHQQLVRIDREKKDHKNKVITQKIFNYLKRYFDTFDAVIISDYGKGLITPELVNFICEKGLEQKKIITVDPKVEHFNYYRHVTAITPNLKETENAIRNIKITSDSSDQLKIRVDKLEKDVNIDLAGGELLRYLQVDSILITLGEHGMRLFEKGKKPFSIKTQAKEVYDVSGAGDTVIAVFTLSLAAGASKREAANLANFSAGVVVGKMGAVAITKQELLKSITTKCP